MMENLYPDGTSIKLVVYPQLPNDKDVPSISFTCNGKLKREFIVKITSVLRVLHHVEHLCFFSEL